MKQFKKLVVASMAMAMTFSLLTGCNTTKPTSGTEKASIYPGTPTANEMTLNLASEPANLFSTTSTDVASGSVLIHIIEPLVTLDAQDKVIPGVATDWTVSEDGLVYTFNLREGMKWSNGEPVTAHDFVFAWTKLLDAETASEYAYFGYILKNGAAYNEGKVAKEEVGVKALSDYQLEVTLENPTPYALSSFAYKSFYPVNEKGYNEIGEVYGTDADKIVTNGAFTLTEWQHDSKIVLTKNPEFYNAKEVEAEKVTMLMMTDSNASVNAFKAGEADMVGPRGELVAALEAEGQPVLQYDDGSCFYLEFNLEDGNVLQNANLRKALSNAIDKQAFVDVVLANSSKAATSFTPPAILGYEGSFTSEVGELVPVLDVDGAKKAYEAALSELGVSTVSLSMICDDTDAAMDTAAFVQEQFKQNLGVEIKVESMPFKSRLERMTNKDFDIVFAGWGPDYNDPMTFLDMFETGNGNNHTSYSSAAYDELLDKVRTELDSKTRFGYLKDLETLLMQDLPISPVYWRNRDYVLSSKIASGVVRTAFQDINVKYVKFNK